MATYKGPKKQKADSEYWTKSEKPGNTAEAPHHVDEMNEEEDKARSERLKKHKKLGEVRKKLGC